MIDLLEALSNLEHNRWAKWQNYVHSKCKKQSDGSLVIPAEFVERWGRQMGTNYYDLSKKEKDSDRKEARNTITLIVQLFIEEEIKQ